jgi:hypothetical protein
MTQRIKNHVAMPRPGLACGETDARFGTQYSKW